MKGRVLVVYDDLALSEMLGIVLRNEGLTDAACNNFVAAKAQGVFVATVFFIDQSTESDWTTKCSSASGSATIVNTLATASSSMSSGAVSKANFDCTTPAGQSAQNTSGSNFFCAASGGQMAPIFKTAFGQLASGTRFIQLPP